MREWVVGFLIDPEREHVMLIRKNRPPWMAGMLNGIGGKVEPGEHPDVAMAREFREETGLTIIGWDSYVRMTAVTTEDRSGVITPDRGVIHFYRAFGDLGPLPPVSITDEHVEVHRIRTLSAPGEGLKNVVPNLLWLIPLACHRSDTYETIDIIEKTTTLRVQPAS